MAWPSIHGVALLILHLPEGIMGREGDVGFTLGAVTAVLYDSANSPPWTGTVPNQWILKKVALPCSLPPPVPPSYRLLPDNGTGCYFPSNGSLADTGYTSSFAGWRTLCCPREGGGLLTAARPANFALKFWTNLGRWCRRGTQSPGQMHS